MRQILILLFILISSVAFGQKHFIGMQAGLNLTNTSAKENFVDTKIRTSFTGGINYVFKFSGKCRFEIDALYSQKGFTDNIILTDDFGVFIGEEKTEFNLDYFCIPLKLGYEIGNKINVIPTIGIVPSYLLKAETIYPKFDSNGNIITHEILNAKKYASKYDFGGLIELGIEHVIYDHLILCSAINYAHSLTTFSNTDYFDEYKLRHYGFSINIGFKYLLK